MIITNKMGLPEPFVQMAQKDYEYKPKRYGVTSLLKPVRQILLTRRHDDEIEQDCADMIWALFGQAVHAVLEKYAEGSLFKEEKLVVELENGYTVSGVIDLYDMENGIVSDYKTASVWKVMLRDYTDWRRQGLAYAWLLKKLGLECKKVVFYALLKDHSKNDAKRKSDYPQKPVKPVDFIVNDKTIEEIDEFIMARLEEIRECEDLPDDKLPLCSPEDRWSSGNKYAVMKKGRKTALRILDTESEAQQYLEENGGDFIEKRLGVDRKCAEYCTCCEFCDYWKANYSNKTGE